VLSEIFLGGVYDVQCEDVHAIVDLGANIGLSTLYLSIRYPSAKIASIEPMTDNVRMLRETIALNGVNSRVFAGAIGASDGFANLAVSASPTVHSLVPGSIGLETVRVPTMSMPSLMTTMGWNTIDLLKIDIEGYEKTLFGSGGDWLSATRMIVGEAHAHVAYGLRDIQKDLAPYGFVVRCESEDPDGGMIIFTARRDGGDGSS
jgi:FkbM family methyltransferase